jgi:O-acetylhomoserine (thiol)-lyase
MKMETLCLHGGTQPDPTTLSRGVPVHRTSSYVFRNSEHAANLFALRELGNIYTRLMNPTTQDVLEKRVALLEGAPEMGRLGPGLRHLGHLLLGHQPGPGGRQHRLRPQPLRRHLHPVQRHPAHAGHHGEVRGRPRAGELRRRHRQPKTRALFVESVSNPALEVTDLAAIAEIAHAHGLPLIVDSTFSTPYLTQPIAHGADIVVHSLTKWFGGHGTGIGGIVVDAASSTGTGKHPLIDTTPSTSYHGCAGRSTCPTPWPRWPSSCACGWSPCATSARASPPTTRGCSCRASRPCPCAWTATARTRWPWPSTSPTTPASSGCAIPGCPTIPQFARNQKYLRGKGGSMVVFGIQGGKRRGPEVHRQPQAASRTWPTWATPAAWPSTPPPPPTRR